LPSLITQLPFSIDSWPLLRDVNVLIAKSPINLLNRAFDGYNNCWPGIILLTSIINILLNSKFTPLYYPSLTAFSSVLFVYILMKRLFNKKSALLAITLLTLTYPISFFTAGFVKEVSALPLYFMLVYLVLNNLSYSLILITIPSLVITHHLTSLIALLTIISITLCRFIRGFEEGKLPLKELVYVFLLALTAYIHYQLLGKYGMKIFFNLDVLVSITSYYVTFMFLTLNIAKYREFPTITKLAVIITPSVIILLIGYSLLVNQYLPRYFTNLGELILYNIHLIILSSYVALGVGYVLLHDSHELVYWLMGILALMTAEVFPPVSNIGIPQYRLINFALYPAVMIASTIVYERRLRKALILANTIVIIICSTICFIQSYNGNSYLGYQWWYKLSEFKSTKTLANLINKSLVVAGDLRVKYLMNGYFNIPIDSSLGLEILMSNKTKHYKNNVLLILYTKLFKVGYLSGELPVKLTSISKFIYNNGLVYNSRVITVSLI